MPVKSHRELDPVQIREQLAPFGISPTEEQTARIRDYIRILLAWNRSINLTAITDPVEIVERHFGESMYASNLLPVENCRLADVGSGAGFPGLALKIAVPSIQLVLIESNKKKCVFLSEVVRSLGISEVEILPERFEHIRSEGIQANVVTSRAVGDFKDLILWAKSKSVLAPRGHLVLWVGAEDSTRIARTRNWTWQPPVRIPESMGRFVLIGRPVQENQVNS
jgi:16S rRNA (guanine527-N7)-methyltransferase